jgi:hypothetical protein
MNCSKKEECPVKKGHNNFNDNHIFLVIVLFILLAIIIGGPIYY